MAYNLPSFVLLVIIGAFLIPQNSKAISISSLKEAWNSWLENEYSTERYLESRQIKDCPPNYSLVTFGNGEGCFKMNDPANRVAYDVAEAQCNQEGATLVSLDTTEKLNAVVTWLKSGDNPFKGKVKDLWVALTFKGPADGPWGSLADYTWPDGSSPPASAWSPNEPSASMTRLGKPDQVSLWKFRGKFLLDNRSKTKPGAYACEKPKVVSVIDACASGNHNCHEFATCAKAGELFHCTCDPGYEGDGVTCTDIDECGTGAHVCHANAVCTNNGGSFSCACAPGFQGNGITCEDVDECTTGSHLCHGDAACTNTGGSFSCQCKNGYVGDGTKCEDTDECAAGTHDCGANSVCTNTGGTFTCECAPGYTGNGKTCTDTDECAAGTHDCGANSVCTNTGGTFTCECAPGYTGNGKTCTDTDECAAGTHDCGANAVCTNTGGSFTCECAPGYTGNGKTCTDTDECAAGTHNCGVNSVCTNTGGTFTCECAPGYTGNGKTCTDTDECAAGTHDCDSNAVCTNTGGSFTCACGPGYTGNGKTCTDTNECTSGTHDCGTNAQCTNTAASFTCACKPGYYGNGKTCAACGGQHCTSCNQNGVCDKCDPKYVLSDKHKTCHPTCVDWGRDVIFLIDSSGSICLTGNSIAATCDNWKIQLKFVADVINNLNIGQGDHQIRIGVAGFATDSYKVFDIDQLFDKNQIKASVQGLSYTQGGTNTYKGLQEVNTMFQRDSRPNAPNYVIMLTDGKPSASYAGNTLAGVVSMATAVKSHARLMTVGITAAVSEPEPDRLMKSVCTAPWKENYWYTPDFIALDSIVGIVSKTICPELNP